MRAAMNQHHSRIWPTPILRCERPTLDLYAIHAIEQQALAPNPFVRDDGNPAGIGDSVSRTHPNFCDGVR